MADLNALYPGATITHTFDLPYAAEDCSMARVSYKQGGKTLLKKETSAFTGITSGTCRLYVELSQSETLKFDDLKEIKIQINLMTEDGKRHTSKPISIPAGEQFDRSVITDEGESE